MFTYLASEEFWRVFYKDLSGDQKALIRDKWEIFKQDPFHPSLGTHKIHKLSARYRTNVYAVCIEGNLRVTFLIRNGNEVFTIDVGTHDIYQ